MLDLMGEWWTGKNLSDFRGGIGQGIDAATGREIRSSGGWIESGSSWQSIEAGSFTPSGW